MCSVYTLIGISFQRLFLTLLFCDLNFQGATPQSYRNSMMGQVNQVKDPNIEIVGNTHINMTNKFVQRVIASGTTYTPYTNPQGKPMFTRRVLDTNRHFVLFPDHSYPPGTGHYIVLRKMMMGIYGMRQEPVYEAYNIFLTNSARAMILNWPNEGPGAMGLDQGQEPKPLGAGTERFGIGVHPLENSQRSSQIQRGINAGEVFTRSKRQSVFMPNFKRIQMNFDSEQDEDLLVVNNFDKEDLINFKGFSIEAED